MRDLNYELKLICRRNRDGSFATQADRERILALVANALRALGFKNLRATSLKPKHVERLVDAWKAGKVSAGAIKNRMSAMRWWAEKIDKPNIVARSNDAYGIERRVFVTNVSKCCRGPESAHFWGLTRSVPGIVHRVSEGGAVEVRRDLDGGARLAILIAGRP